MPLIKFANGQEREELRQLLESAFSVTGLEIIVAAATSDPFVRSIPFGTHNPQLVTLRIVDEGNQKGVLDRIFVKAVLSVPDRPDLRAMLLRLQQRPGWALGKSEPATASALESLTTGTNPLIDISRFAHWLIRTERHVGQVRCGSELGTGFLVGADLVLTCYHVVRGHLIGGLPPTDVQVRFDHRVLPDGTLSSGTQWLDIDPKWTIPGSRWSKADETGHGEPAGDELDYALLKLRTPIGADAPPKETFARGWVDLSGSLPIPQSNDDAVLIVQHPLDLDSIKQPPVKQQPLQLAFAKPGLMDPILNPGGTRVAYKPSTLKGSSGAPVFDGQLRVFGLHHNRGQIDPAATGRTLNNRGTPLERIRAHVDPKIQQLLVAPPPSI
jgi:hypothetical protein